LSVAFRIVAQLPVVDAVAHFLLLEVELCRLSVGSVCFLFAAKLFPKRIRPAGWAEEMALSLTTTTSCR
jgi:hypothetical protein